MEIESSVHGVREEEIGRGILAPGELLSMNTDGKRVASALHRSAVRIIGMLGKHFHTGADDLDIFHKVNLRGETRGEYSEFENLLSGNRYQNDERAYHAASQR